MHTEGATPPLGAQDVLAAVGTGLWRWDNSTGTVALDEQAAELLGLNRATLRKKLMQYNISAR